MTLPTEPIGRVRLLVMLGERVGMTGDGSSVKESTCDKALVADLISLVAPDKMPES